MADRIEINFTANTREVTRGTDEIASNLKDTERALEEVGDAGKDSLSKVTDAQDELVQSTGKVGDAFGDVGSIAKDALQGDVASATEKVGSSVAALAAGIPFVGAAVGVLATEGVGLLVGNLQQAQAEADRLSERITAAYKKAAEDGRASLDELQIQAEVIDLTFDADTRAKAQADAIALGLDYQTVIRAQAGDQAALNQVLEAGNQLEAERRGWVAEQGPLFNARLGASEHELRTLIEINSRYQTQQDIQQQNIAAAQLIATLTGANREDIQKANKLLADTPRSIPVTIDVDSSSIDRALRQQRSLNVEVQLTRHGTAVR